MNLIKEIPYILPGELIVSDSPKTLRTTLGSCIAVCLYDPHLRIGGMNHYMFARSSDPSAGLKYGDLSIHELIKRMTSLGSRISSLQASLAGGASRTSSTGRISVGEKNILIAEEILKEYNIPVVFKDIGGCYGRKVRFTTDSGSIAVELLDDCLSSCKTSGHQCQGAVKV